MYLWFSFLSFAQRNWHNPEPPWRSWSCRKSGSVLPLYIVFFFLIKSHIVLKFSETILGLGLGNSVTECLPSILKALGSWVQYPASWENTPSITIKPHTLLSAILIFSPKWCGKTCKILQNSKICVQFCFTFWGKNYFWCSCILFCWVHPDCNCRLW